MQFLAIALLSFIAVAAGRSSSSSSSVSTGTGSLVPGSGAAGTKYVSIKGEVFCGPVKASKVIVKLFPSLTDTTPIQLANSDVNTGRGTFTLEGESQQAAFEPVLAIYHNCEYDNKDKLRRVLIKIPQSYVTTGRMAKQTYNIGKLNLELTYPKETHENAENLNNRFLRRLLKKMFF
uniref:Uncharacterized protein n=1 Tax=Plectus sambesii TaxID=2011161 RepID=A0A914XL09_9BILA